MRDRKSSKFYPRKKIPDPRKNLETRFRKNRVLKTGFVRDSRCEGHVQEPSHRLAAGRLAPIWVTKNSKKSIFSRHHQMPRNDLEWCKRCQNSMFEAQNAPWQLSKATVGVIWMLVVGSSGACRQPRVVPWTAKSRKNRIFPNITKCHEMT